VKLESPIHGCSGLITQISIGLGPLRSSTVFLGTNGQKARNYRGPHNEKSQKSDRKAESPIGSPRVARIEERAEGKWRLFQRSRFFFKVFCA